MLKNIRSLHFIGIGGVGMSALAEVLLSKGYQITGSDLRENELIHKLRTKGVKIYQGHSSNHVQKPEIIVVSSAIKADNPELTEALRKEIPVISRGKLLSWLVNDTQSIIIAGTHGKTTTASFISHLLIKAEEDPTIFLGGELNEIRATGFLGKGRWTVVESDESDGSFLFLHPQLAVLTSLENDHLDYYGSEEKLREAFKQFIQNLKKGGTLIFNSDDVGLKKVSEESSSLPPFLTYGIDSVCDLRASDIKYRAFFSSFQIAYRGKFLGRVTCPLPGKYNIYNCLASLLVSLTLGLNFHQSRDHLSSFQGIKRRFQKIGEVSSIIILDDYAHHPTEIRSVLQAAKLLKKRIIAVFQPHRYTRTKLLLPAFTRAFTDVDLLVLTKIYPAGESSQPGISGQRLFEEIKSKKGSSVYFFPTQKEILDFLKKEVTEEDLLITLGAGDINSLGKKFLTWKRESIQTK